jgi:hypothetical protein
MKGIVHFMTGVTAASFFPFAVRAAEEGNPAYFILGGAFGILPDTIDFKFIRYFYRHDVTIDPDPRRPDPRSMAEAIAGAIRAAAGRPEGCRVKLNSLRLGADAWQQYRVRFDPDQRVVEVRFGPVVNTGQVPLPGRNPPTDAVGTAAFDVPVLQTYDAVTTVDIFDGPSFLFQKADDGPVEIHFLPWHRNGSHSYLVGLAFGLLAWLVWGLAALAADGTADGFAHGWKALAVIALGYAGHLAEDQLGFMGSNLLFPLTKRRLKGLHWMRSGDALPNFLAVWICALLIFWNLARLSTTGSSAPGLLSIALYGGVLPLGAYGLLSALVNRGRRREALDMADEWGDPMMR